MKNTDKNIIGHKRKTLRKIKSKKTPKKSQKKSQKSQKKTIKNTKIKITCRNSKRKLMKGGDEEDVCAICLDKFKNQDDTITLSCGHRFHKECITDACNKSRNTRNCFCPYCRKELTHEDKAQIGFIPTLTPIQTAITTNRDPPYLDEIDDFRQYINNKLRAPTRLPLEALNNSLDEFLGTDALPVYILEEIMEFDLQQIGPLYRYRFIGIVQNVPRDRGNKKYFVYTQWEDDQIEPPDDDNIVMNVYEV